MRVGILGSGMVGQSLATAFAEHHHEVMMGTRSPDKPELVQWKSSVHGTVSLGSFAATAQYGEIVVLCCLGTAVDAVLDAAGSAHLKAKLVIDTTNALDTSKGMPPGLFTGPNDSLGERVQARLPESRVVKCFNIVPSSVMGHPRIGGEAPTMIIAGNDPAAKAQVAGILKEFGWSEPIDLGGIEESRWLETLVGLWIRVALKLGNFGVAFKLLR
jgi:8-hydroxy-5-deazaflavin:NADPH oxidoreductase